MDYVSARLPPTIFSQVPLNTSIQTLRCALVVEELAQLVPDPVCKRELLEGCEKCHLVFNRNNQTSHFAPCLTLLLEYQALCKARLIQSHPSCSMRISPVSGSCFGKPALSVMITLVNIIASIRLKCRSSAEEICLSVNPS